MSDERPRPADRESPVGEPVIRGDPDVLGERAAEAESFDPDDPESVARAVEVVREFAAAPSDADPLFVLRGAAACAALVRGEGSYTAAAQRVAGDGGDETATVSFIRKWARVHDLPYAVRRHVAAGNVVPTAAKHIARVDGEARLLLAWAVLDADLTVRAVRRIASDVNDGTPMEAALADQGVTTGQLTVELPVEAYVELRRRATVEDRSPDELVAAALADRF